ncbi:uncharacterized protein BO97DRAFT_417311 [Aspergillus homomorphus CBS 101889]|uniref:Uncharacterized protein n=1 Tax=Aspergillus homomorphus (strain CBS 101889) TaxID=1450537 RepID=A0A395HLM6_ASPHC|nr:hypothetical protein BO97DRAFT_417311 [Aspergillus homomorphus CBS 101889]RAL08842.1 hypothetical protein BO97DRAFT_417311 [Aspergillus homomorphus CBS 101889]
MTTPRLQAAYHECLLRPYLVHYTYIIHCHCGIKRLYPHSPQPFHLNLIALIHRSRSHRSIAFSSSVATRSILFRLPVFGTKAIAFSPCLLPHHRLFTSYGDTGVSFFLAPSYEIRLMIWKAALPDPIGDPLLFWIETTMWTPGGGMTALGDNYIQSGDVCYPKVDSPLLQVSKEAREVTKRWIQRQPGGNTDNNTFIRRFHHGHHNLCCPEEQSSPFLSIVDGGRFTEGSSRGNAYENADKLLRHITSCEFTYIEHRHWDSRDPEEFQIHFARIVGKNAGYASCYKNKYKLGDRGSKLSAPDEENLGHN